jgi:hypothetical protein
MRRDCRVDANHLDIAHALRRAGVHVTSLAAVGNGVPDLLLSFRGRWFVAEIKDGAKYWKLTSHQKLFIESAKADVLLLTCVDDVELWLRQARW